MLTWLRRWWCAAQAHETELDWSLDGCRLFVVCRRCWVPSPGIDVTPKAFRFRRAPLKFPMVLRKTQARRWSGA